MLTKEKVKESQIALEGLGLILYDAREVFKKNVHFDGNLDKNYGNGRLEPLLDESICIYLEVMPLPLQGEVGGCYLNNSLFLEKGQDIFLSEGIGII